MNPSIEQIIRADLMRHRTLSTKQASVICSCLDVNDPLEGLASDAFGDLEDYEVEWLLAGLFTPGDNERVACEPRLPTSGLTAAALEELIDTINRHAPLSTLTFDQRKITILVPPVLVDRYVRLLHLDRCLDEEVVAKLRSLVDDISLRYITSLARQDAWQPLSQRQLLQQIVTVLGSRSGRIDGDLFTFMTEMVYSGRPHSIEIWLTQLRNLLESYRLEQEHPVYNPRLEEYQGNSVRSQLCGEQIKAHRLAMAHAWIALLG
ncbi:MAG: hypothetical protein HQL60_02750 [Magnetococcales bacterium]|nr:hypothetical protein [Magnetococcales bacterium]